MTALGGPVAATIKRTQKQAVSPLRLKQATTTGGPLSLELLMAQRRTDLPTSSRVAYVVGALGLGKAIHPQSM